MVKRLRLLFVVVLGMTLLTGCGYFGVGSPSGGVMAQGKMGDNWGKPEKPKFKIPVTVERVQRGRMYAYLQARGTVVPIKELELKPEMTGRIYYTKRWVEGDEVKKGDILARIDDRELNRQVEMAELQWQMAKEEITPASANLAQAYKDEAFKKAMFERGAIAKYEFDQSSLRRIQQVNAYDMQLKTVRNREMDLQKIKQELEKVPIEIPYDGVLLPAKESVSINQKATEDTDLTLFNGQMIGQGTVLCRLANIEKVYAALDVPAKELEDIRIGQKVEVEVYTKSAAIFMGEVADISTALNANTRTYTVNVLLDNPKHELRPGMFAKSRIITEERPDAISVPRELVLLRNNRQVLYVVKEKPAEEIKSVTSEVNGSPADQPRALPQPSLARGGGLEKVAVASDAVAQSTDTTLVDDPLDSEPPAEEEMYYVAEERVVKTGIENREQVEITDGLQAGDILVVLGYETLTDGVDVNITIRDNTQNKSLDESLREATVSRR